MNKRQFVTRIAHRDDVRRLKMRSIEVSTLVEAVFSEMAKVESEQDVISANGLFRIDFRPNATTTGRTAGRDHTLRLYTDGD